MDVLFEFIETTSIQGFNFRILLLGKSYEIKEVPFNKLS